MTIEFDYTLKRYQGLSTRIFRPEAIKSPLANISNISAPNSSGKSTLMNIIALSLFGTNSRASTVNESLKKQISSLTDHSIQDITFRLRITDKSGKNGLFVSKDSFDSMDIIRKEIINGTEKHIASDTFHDRYKLIYDIPDNPLERLKELTVNIKTQQTRWQSKLASLIYYVNTNIRDLLKRKQDYDIPSIEKNRASAQGNLELVRNNKISIEAKLGRLKKYYFLKKYLTLKEQYESKKEESKEINRVKKEKSKERKAKETEFREKAEESGRIHEKIKSLKERISQNFVEVDLGEEPGFSKWNAKIKQTPTRESLQDDLDFVKKIEARCSVELEKYQNESSVEEVEFYDRLVSWIRDNLSSNYKVPGTEMTFSLLMEKLDGIVEENRNKIARKRRLKNINDWINELRGAIQEFEELSETISKKYSDMTKAQRDSKIKEISDKKLDYESLIRQLNKDMQSLALELSKLGLNEENEFYAEFNALVIRFPEFQTYDSFSFNKIESEIKNLTSKIESLSQDEQRERLIIETLEKQLEAARNAKPHIFGGKEKQLSILLESLNTLSSAIASWDNFMQDYKPKTSGSEGNFGVSPERVDYFNRVSRYLARRMVVLTHVDRKYELKEVDLINSKFVATDGTVIHFQVMGSGQRQLTYILNKLSYDGRIIIAMFDEVAIMTPTTMRDILNRMRSLMDDGGKLLVGLLVSPSDEVKIIDG